MDEQNFKNHGRTDPAFHYVLIPIFLINLVLAVVRLVHHPNHGWQGPSSRGPGGLEHGGMGPDSMHHALAGHLWGVLLALALLALAFLVRIYALRVQDRVIRLEERIRMAALLPMEMQMLQRELTTRQIIALRFASDAELALLVEKTVREQLTPKAIKQSIRTWRPDTHRV